MTDSPRSSDSPIIFGEVLFDCFEDGTRVLGGAPFNVAWHLQAFGLSPRLCSRVGDDAPGHEVLEAMRAWGMQTQCVQVDRGHQTGQVLVHLEGSEPSYDILADQAYDFMDTNSVPGTEPGLLYHGSLALRSETTRRALSGLQDRWPDCPVFMDVNLRPPWTQPLELFTTIEKARWIKLNEAELDAFDAAHSSRPGSGSHGAPESLDSRARRFVDRFRPELLVVTVGEQGAVTYCASGESHRVRPHLATEVVDTVGAGDGFTAVCILGLVSDWPVPLTLERAQQFASTVVGLRGATTTDRTLYARLRESWGA